MDVYTADLSDRCATLKREALRLDSKPVKYIDPAFSIEPTTGIPLFDRARKLRDEVGSRLPDVSLPRIPYQYRDGVGDDLKRDELRALVHDLEVITTALQAQSQM